MSYDAVAAVCSDEEMLTDAARRFQKQHPILWPVLVYTVAAHLNDHFNHAKVPHLDPFTRSVDCARWLVHRIWGL